MRRKFRNKPKLFFNSLLVVALPIFEAVKPLLDSLHTALPELQAYLPENIYKTMGLTVVLANIALDYFGTKGEPDDPRS